MPNNTAVLPNGSTSFKCSVMPGAVYSWVHNGRKINMEESNGKYFMQPNGLLEINDVSEHDEGTFVCLAQNKAGLSAASAVLTLGGKCY